MTPQQKISVIALGVFAAAAITLGLLHVHQGILASVAWNPGAQQIEETSDEKNQKDDVAELQGKDTDNDGLSDYEELQVFSTSPYLADTDGDNISDTKEIQAGTDPNCPEGKQCGVTPPLVEEKQASPLTSEVEVEPGMPSQEQLEKLQTLLTGKDITPDQVRQLLAEAGVDTNVLQKVDDATLMKIYADVLKQFKETGTAPAQ